MSVAAVVPAGVRYRVMADALAGSTVRTVVLMCAGAGLVGAAAQLVLPVPGSPVPVTGQTFAVLLVGAALGPARGAGSLTLYVGAGALGVPWYAAGASGVAVPTLGYLLGFVVAAALAGLLAARRADRTPLRVAGLMLAGSLTIYLLGVPWLAYALGVDLPTALRLGAWPYLAGDAVKLAVAMAVLPGAWRLLQYLDGRRTAGRDDRRDRGGAHNTAA